MAFNNPSAVRVYRINRDFTPDEEVTQPGPIDAGIFAHQVRVTLDNRLAILVTRGNPLRDEGELYAEKLKAARVPVAISRYSGVNHGFMFWVGVVDRTGVAMDEACGWRRGIFAGPR